MRSFFNPAAWLSFVNVPNLPGLNFSLPTHARDPPQRYRHGTIPSCQSQSASRNRTVSLSMTKQIRRNAVLEPSKGIYKRQSTIKGSLYEVLSWSVGGSYYVSITAGTPPQNITAILDTGSSDLYLDASSASACQDLSSQFSCRGGSYNASDSSTYSLVAAGQFNSTFGDGTNVFGDFVTDTVAIGDVSLQGVQFGVANHINSTSGYAISLMGVGYSYIESSAIQYPNMPELLHQTGAIDSRLYSVYLNDVNTGTGTLLFGGIDTAKFTGPLTTLNLLPRTTADDSGQSTQDPLVTEFVTMVTAVSTVVKGKTTSLLQVSPRSDDALPVLLDTGSSAWTVPQGLYDSIIKAFGGAVDDQNNIPCSHQDDDVRLELEFGGLANITVAASQFIVPFFDPATNEQYKTSDGDGLCAFMIQPDTDGSQFLSQGFTTLGDAVLRSAYVVYDLDNGQVSLAQAVLNTTDSNVKPVSAGPDGVAKAVGTGGTVVTASTNSYMVATEFIATQTISASSLSRAVGTATGAVQTDGQAVTGSSAAAAGHTSSHDAGKGHKSGAGVAYSCPSSLPGLGLALLYMVIGAMIQYVLAA